MVDYHTQKTNIIREEVEGDIVFSECGNLP